jgi:hypothetical protein
LNLAVCPQPLHSSSRRLQGHAEQMAGSCHWLLVEMHGWSMLE